MASGPLDALEKFKTLEERIARTLETLRKTRGEKKQIEYELGEARQQMKVMRKEIDGLRRERTLVRGRVASLIETIAEVSEKHIV